MKRILPLLAALFAAAGASAQETLLSPDGDLKLTFRLSETGAPTYALDFRGRAAVLPSAMGLELRGDAPALEFGTEIKKGGYGAPVSLYDRFEQTVRRTLLVRRTVAACLGRGVVDPQPL